LTQQYSGTFVRPRLFTGFFPIIVDVFRLPQSPRLIYSDMVIPDLELSVSGMPTDDKSEMISPLRPSYECIVVLKWRTQTVPFAYMCKNADDNHEDPCPFQIGNHKGSNSCLVIKRMVKCSRGSFPFCG